MLALYHEGQESAAPCSLSACRHEHTHTLTAILRGGLSVEVDACRQCGELARGILQQFPLAAFEADGLPRLVGHFCPCGDDVADSVSGLCVSCEEREEAAYVDRERQREIAHAWAMNSAANRRASILLAEPLPEGAA